MYRTINFRLPARRSAAVLGAATAVAAGAVLAVAPAVQAVPATAHDTGAATATDLRAGLDVSLLGRTVDVPVNVSLNDVHAPADAKQTALTVTVGHGVEAGRAVNLLRASAATANATTGPDKAQGVADIVGADLHVPGLPLLSVVKLDAVTSTATCQVGHRPTASSHLVGLTVLGRRTELSAIGTTKVAVPGVGEVDLELTDAVTTSATAAATALHLKVDIDPLSLGVAHVTGDITLAQATCRTPKGDSGSSSGGASTGGSSSGAATAGSSGGSSTGGADTGGSTGGHSSGGSGNGGGTSGGSGSGGSSGSAGSAGSSGSSGSAGSSGSSASGGSGGSGAQTVADTSSTGDLAETGASSSTPYVAGGAAALVAAGALTFVVANRRRRAAGSPTGGDA
ncbi:putative ATP/GTP binding protein [Actinacidiphila reveromycinica]|uniref:Putative ATP/GTP binding protein n=1 Tax=Actinacidiphila reveromycinica TaxID=659352 RepID=A0A7U3UQ03_9ACTN|nr:SCO1860 family LAETG-anchored protein [Streptomyces sp. SN-593]BBA96580.1 putative ATP/GTP binding protein [Streptomyces sp. SN-593]